ncbi:MAG: carbohydrate binding family 9 domain-containing protein [Bacteroidota bacterium]|nr:carbohydrate binding family 9 domain-containing protein [Bacteroidota bacterium]
MRKLVFTVSAFCLFTIAIAQSKDPFEAFQQNFQLHISKTNSPIKIDGRLTEDAWKDAQTTTPFWKKFPNDDGRPTRQTEVKVTYDNKFLYIGITAYDSGKVFAQTLKRDFGHDGNDGIGIVLDPNNQHINGFFFVVSALNGQSEDQLPLSNDGPWSWDNKWYSATKIYKDKWTVEVAIPFKSIRYTSDKLVWGINFIRVDPKTNEYSTWTHVPLNFQSHDLGFTGSLIWNQPPPSPGKNIVTIPYITSNTSQNKEENIPTQTKINAGMDGKFALSSSLNLDLTINPDFSQVDVDKQVTNLSRFSVYYPEKRGFFLENSDLFSRLGQGDIRPFYSRTIGLDSNNNPIPILLGARLTGNINKSTRIGLMNIQTASQGSYNAENYSAATIQHNLFQRSTFKAYFLDRENFISPIEKRLNPLSSFGRNAGTEFDYSNLSGSLKGYASFNHSYKEGIHTDDNFINGGFGYKSRHWSVRSGFTSVGTNYYTDMGYAVRINNYDALRDTTVRVGYKEAYNSVTYSFYSKTSSIHTQKINVFNDFYFNPDNSLNEHDTRLQYNLLFTNTGSMGFFVTNTLLNLLYPVSFTNSSYQPLPAAHYNFTQAFAYYQSDFRKPFSYYTQIAGGGFYNGTKETLVLAGTYRNSAHMNVSVNFEYDNLNFPTPYGSAELFLIAPKVEYDFSTKMFWTTFLQYNTQNNNFNINSRFQYRFKPMSDLFLVYTDNYYTTPLLQNKNRALVFKMDYWFNM